MKVLLVFGGLCLVGFGGFWAFAANKHAMNVAYYGNSEASRRYGTWTSALSEEEGFQCAGLGVLLVLVGAFLPKAKRAADSSPAAPGS